MKHIKLFESWGDPIDRSSPKFILIQKNHYLTQERKIGYYKSREKAIQVFLEKFKIFIYDEGYGIPKRYFSEWNEDVNKIHSWDEFFSKSPEIDEYTFYVEDFDPSKTTLIFSEVDLLHEVYKKDPTYLDSFLPFS